MNIQPGDRVSIVAINGQRYFGTVSWIDGVTAAVWWDVTNAGWRGPAKWLRKESN